MVGDDHRSDTKSQLIVALQQSPPEVVTRVPDPDGRQVVCEDSPAVCSEPDLTDSGSPIMSKQEAKCRARWQITNFDSASAQAGIDLRRIRTDRNRDDMTVLRFDANEQFARLSVPDLHSGIVPGHYHTGTVRAQGQSRDPAGSFQAPGVRRPCIPDP